MAASELEMLRWQYRLTWQLAVVHLPALDDDACLWEPAPSSWTVRKSANGKWWPDWAEPEPEPDPAPPVTIGWLSWHLIWWWSSLQSATRNETPTARAEIAWPGSAEAVVERLQSLAAQWTDILSKLADADLERPLAYPWPEPRPLRLALAWANSELMKNVAEIGTVRHLYEASKRAR
jgi:hypothetical protein